MAMFAGLDVEVLWQTQRVSDFGTDNLDYGYGQIDLRGWQTQTSAVPGACRNCPKRNCASTFDRSAGHARHDNEPGSSLTARARHARPGGPASKRGAQAIGLHRIGTDQDIANCEAIGSRRLSRLFPGD